MLKSVAPLLSQEILKIACCITKMSEMDWKEVEELLDALAQRVCMQTYYFEESKF